MIPIVVLGWAKDGKRAGVIVPIKVWGAPAVGVLMFCGGIWDHNIIVAALGILVAFYGTYRVTEYLSIPSGFSETGPDPTEQIPSTSGTRAALVSISALVVIVAAAAVYCYQASAAARASSTVPIGARLETVTRLVASPPVDMQTSGEVMTCTYEFDDFSKLKCVFVQKTEEQKYTDFEMQTKVVGTQIEQKLSGFIPNMYGAIPTYDYDTVPRYGDVLTPVEKTRMVPYWSLGNVRVEPNIGAPTSRLIASIQMPSAPTAIAPAATTASTGGNTSGATGGAATSPTRPTKSLSAVEFSRGHVPQPGSKERAALMGAVRERLKTSTKFVVNAVVAAGGSAVADIQAAGGGKRRLVRLDKVDGRWKVSVMKDYTENGFYELTGTTEDSEVTGEL